MARYYDVSVKWREGPETRGRGIGNNAAWVCKCREVLLGPYEERYQIPPCPKCGRQFRIVKGPAPRFVAFVEEMETNKGAKGLD